MKNANKSPSAEQDFSRIKSTIRTLEQHQIDAGCVTAALLAAGRSVSITTGEQMLNVGSTGSTPPPERWLLLRRLEACGISIHAAAAQLGVDRGHLYRVLHGYRPGSRALLESVAGLVPADGVACQKDAGQLFDAAVHLFFIKRGRFESAIFRDKEE